MKKTAFNFHRKIIRPADDWLFEFLPGCGRLWLWCHGYGAGRPRKSTAMKTSSSECLIFVGEGLTDPFRPCHNPSVDTSSCYANVNNLLNVDCSRRKHSPIGRMVQKIWHWAAKWLGRVGRVESVGLFTVDKNVKFGENSLALRTCTRKS